MQLDETKARAGFGCSIFSACAGVARAFLYEPDPAAPAVLPTSQATT